MNGSAVEVTSVPSSDRAGKEGKEEGEGSPPNQMGREEIFGDREKLGEF